MTVASTLNRKTFSGDGVTTSFGTSPLVYFDSDEIDVYIVTTSTGAILATLTEGTHYTISGGGTPAAVGTINMAAGSSPYGAPASGTTVLIVRTLDIIQETDFVNNDQQDADVLEAALDKGVMILQQLNARIERSFKLADTDISGASGTLPTPAASSLIGWDGTGLALQNYTTSVLSLALTTAYALTLLDDPDAATARATLGIALTTKGDVLAGTGSNAVTRKAVGTNGYRLSGNSGDTDGLRYLPPGMGHSLINGYLDWTVSSNALTCAIKGLDGNDPSSTNPVYAWIRSSTATTGSPSLVAITAATSVVVSSGSTLGTRSAVPSRVWAVLFDDAGIYRLGVINCLTTVAGTGAGSDVTTIYPLGQFPIASSTAEGGAGAADSAGTFYTGTAVSSKPYTVLGYATFEGGQATAGTWATAASRKQLYMPEMPLPGNVIQVQRNDTGAVATGTTTLPADDTIPQITEGDQYMTQAITPSSAANVIQVSAAAILANSAAVTNDIVAALFQDATANALRASVVTQENAGRNHRIAIDAFLLAGTSSATTFRIRGGGPSAGTTTFNGVASARKYGGVENSFLSAMEIMG